MLNRDKVKNYFFFEQIFFYFFSIKSHFYRLISWIQLYLTKKVGTNISSKPLETTKPNGSSHLGVHIESNENPINYEVEDKIKE